MENAESTATIVTSENFQQFVADNMSETPIQAVDLDAEPGEPEVKEEIKPAEKRKKGISDRFSELTNARKDAEAKATEAETKLTAAAAEAKSLREERSKAQEEAQALRAKYEPPKSDELGPKPAPSQFTDINEYSQALEEWTTEKAIKTHKEAERKAQDNAKRGEVVKTWQERQAKFVTDNPDYQAKIDASDVKVHETIQEAILESDIGPKILLHLAENPDVAESLGKMTIAKALREFGKLEDRLAEGKPEQKAVKVAEISRAPAPISPLKGAVNPITRGLDSNGVFHGTFDDWKAARKAGRI